MNEVDSLDDTIAMRPFSESLPMALLRSRETVMRMFRAGLAEHDLTEQQWRVLRALAATGSSFEVAELAEHTFLLPPSLSRILANLEGRSLISRSAVPHDQRRSLIMLTTTGRDLVGRVAPGSEEAYELIEERFGRERLRGLLKELHDLALLDLDQQIGDPV